MSCYETRWRITQLLENIVKGKSDAEKVDFTKILTNEHLKICPECREWFKVKVEEWKKELKEKNE